MGLNLRRFDNADILCRDLEAMRRFYTEVLELPLFLPYDPANGFVSIDCGNLALFILQTPAGEHAAPRTSDNAVNPPGFDSMAFEVDDLDAAIATLDAKGVLWAGEVIRADHSTGAWWRYRGFHDPEGNLLYVTEPHHGRSMPGR